MATEIENLRGALRRKGGGTMKRFTFFFRDGTIEEQEGETANDAFRALCARLGKSWGYLRTEVETCLAPT